MKCNDFSETESEQILSIAGLIQIEGARANISMEDWQSDFLIDDLNDIRTSWAAETKDEHRPDTVVEVILAKFDLKKIYLAVLGLKF